MTKIILYPVVFKSHNPEYFSSPHETVNVNLLITVWTFLWCLLKFLLVQSYLHNDISDTQMIIVTTIYATESLPAYFICSFWSKFWCTSICDFKKCEECILASSYFYWVSFWFSYRDNLQGFEAWKCFTPEQWACVLDRFWFVMFDILQTTGILVIKSCLA